MEEPTTIHKSLHAPRILDKAKISSAQWEAELKNIMIIKKNLDHMVMNYLVMEGDAEAAQKFQMESGTEHIDLSTIPNRMAIKMSALNGNIPDAIEKANDLNPEILDRNPELIFHLQQQRLIELIRNGKVKEALEISYAELAPRATKNPDLLEEFERTTLLFAYDDLSNCPVNKLMDMSQRLKIASELNAAILTSQGLKKESMLSLFLKKGYFGRKPA